MLRIPDDVEGGFALEYALIALAIVGLCAGLHTRDRLRHRKRRNSLHHDAAAGGFIWTDFDGQVHRSPIHPASADGAWGCERRWTWSNLGGGTETSGHGGGGVSDGGDGGAC